MVRSMSAKPGANGPVSLEWRTGEWAELREPASLVRRAVFVQEMGVDEALDFDGTDDEALHVVVSIKELPIGTGRLHRPEARIGRLAVLRGHRGQGIGRRILERLLQEAIRSGFPEVCLHAQEHAIAFYRKMGFREEGELFDEAGIPHRFMRRKLA